MLEQERSKPSRLVRVYFWTLECLEVGPCFAEWTSEMDMPMFLWEREECVWAFLEIGGIEELRVFAERVCRAFVGEEC
jgi:hypothetical protein